MAGRELVRVLDLRRRPARPARWDAVEDVVAAAVRRRRARLRPRAGRRVQPVRVDVGPGRVVEKGVVRLARIGGRRPGRRVGGGRVVGEIVGEGDAERAARREARARAEEVRLAVDVAHVRGRDKLERRLRGARVGENADAGCREREREAVARLAARRQEDGGAGEGGERDAGADVDHGEACGDGRGAGCREEQEQERAVGDHRCKGGGGGGEKGG